MTHTFDLVVHATHEAGVKVGGIGAVLDGMLREPSYNAAVQRTVLVGPFNRENATEMERLFAPRNGLRVRYFSSAGVYDVPEALAQALTRVELDFHVAVLYGTRRFGENEHEVLLVDARHTRDDVVRDYKYHLWERYGIDSYRYEQNPEYETFIRAAEPSLAALQALVGQVPPKAVMIAHEWLGLPLVFSARRHVPGAYKTVFYAHEVATVRPLVENHPGHDTRFYNVMYAARDRGLFLPDVFGDQSHYFKHALVMAAAPLDGFFAVGDLVVDELRFLSPHFAERRIDLVYNGVPATALSLDARHTSTERLRTYAQNLLGVRPTWVFSHVTRMVVSKALWRDIRVMEHLDALLAARGESAVLFTLSSAIPTGRRAEDVWRWEAEYGWPVYHRADNGDLVGLEVDYYRAIQAFNQRAQATRIVLVNQFGWDRERCGRRMPADMQFADLRQGTHIEFGQSIYEPFGIAQLEPLTAGALCCVSNVCGCVGFVHKAGGEGVPNVVVADYVTPVAALHLDIPHLLAIGQQTRDMIEAATARKVAMVLAERLPRTPEAANTLLENGFALAQRMSWDVVVRDYLIPAMAAL